MALTSELGPRDKLGLELLNACYFGNVTLALRLLQNPQCPASWADPRDGWSAMHYAARWGKVRILEALLQAGVDINIKTLSKETPLHKAARANRKPICVWLLNRGADADLLSSTGERASHLTADDDIKYVCDHFEEYQVKHTTMVQEVQAKTKAKVATTKTKTTSPHRRHTVAPAKMDIRPTPHTPTDSSQVPPTSTTVPTAPTPHPPPSHP